MKINRKGVTRIVFEFDKVVVKIPNFTCQWNHFLTGLLANMNEAKTWEISKSNQGDYLLCPVVWASWGGWVLIMKKAVQCELDEQINYNEWLLYGFGGDDQPYNYGHYEGRIVKIDYGQLGF